MGLIGSASGSKTTRGNQDMEVVYTPTLGLNELNPRWYQVERRRIGFTGAFDVKPTDNSTYTVRAVFNRFIDDHENRQRVRYAVANRRIDHELRDRTHIERISSLSLTGQQIAAGSTTIDYQVLGAYSDQRDPLTMTTVFRHSNINVRAQCERDVDRPRQHSGQPAERKPRQLQLQLTAPCRQFREGPRYRGFAERADRPAIFEPVHVSAESGHQGPRQTQGARPQRDELHDNVHAQTGELSRDRLRPAAISRRPVRPHTLHQSGCGREHPERRDVHRRVQSRARRRELRWHRADVCRVRDGRDLRRSEAVPASLVPLRVHDGRLHRPRRPFWLERRVARQRSHRIRRRITVCRCPPSTCDMP